MQLQLFEGYAPPATARRARPAASSGALNVLHEVAGRLVVTANAAGADRLGLHKGSLRLCIDAGYLLQVDTGDPNTDGGRYRLQLTAAGSEQIRLDNAHRDATAMPSGVRRQGLVRVSA